MDPVAAEAMGEEIMKKIMEDFEKMGEKEVRSESVLIRCSYIADSITVVSQLGFPTSCR